MTTVKRASGRQLSGKLHNRSSGFEMHKDMGTATKNHLFLLFFFSSDIVCQLFEGLWIAIGTEKQLIWNKYIITKNSSEGVHNL